MGARIREAREKAKMTQESLATALGVTKGSVYQWEKDISNPSTGNLSEIAVVTGVSFEWLATGRGHREYTYPAASPAFVGAVNDGRIDLSNDEYCLVERFRNLPQCKRDALLTLLSLEPGQKPSDKGNKTTPEKTDYRTGWR